VSVAGTSTAAARRGDAPFDQHEQSEQRGTGAQEPGDGCRGPAVVDALVDGIHDGHEASGDRESAGDIGPFVTCPNTGRHVPGDEGDERGTDGNVDEEDPLPPRSGGERPADDHADRRCAAADGPEDGQRLVACRTLRKRVDQDRQCGGRGQRRAEPLARPGGHQLAQRSREPGGERRDREQPEAADQHLPSAEQIGGPAAQQQEATEHQPVGDDHPLQIRLSEAQVGLHRRQGHVHDGDVEDDHELGAAHQRQDQSGAGGSPCHARFCTGWGCVHTSCNRRRRGKSSRRVCGGPRVLPVWGPPRNRSSRRATPPIR
jgi:hypothetical protein